MNDRGRKQDSFVDELLEASLARYQSEKPRPGLETRILAGVRAKAQAVQRATWLLAFGAVAATVLIISAGMYVVQRSPAPATHRASESAPSRMGSPEAGLAPKAIPPKPRGGVVVYPALRPSRRARSVPRRPEQFPTPAPLSKEERLLLVYVSQVPRSDLTKPVFRDPEIEPLEIPELKVAMIEIKDLPRPIN